MAAQSNRRASDQRVVLLVPHTGSMGNVATTERVVRLLSAAGISVRIVVDDRTTGVSEHPYLSQYPLVAAEPEAARGCELVLVLGGDGTFCVLQTWHMQLTSRS